MTSADAMRASDSDREKVVQALQEQVGEGRLTLAEFEQRSSEAYATAKTVGDLRALMSDLPVDPLAPPRPPLGAWQQPWPMPPADVPPMSQWQQRTFPQNRQPGGPLRRVHPMRIAVAAILLIWAVGAVLSVVAHVPFVWPILAVFFFVFARGGRRRYYR